MGSFVQLPSTRYLYSCLPGLKFRDTCQLPSLDFFSVSDVALQLLNVPAIATFFAYGALRLNCTFLVLALAVNIAISLTPSYLFFLLAPTCKLAEYKGN